LSKDDFSTFADSSIIVIFVKNYYLKKVAIVSALTLTFFSSCFYDNEEDLYPVSPNSYCDTSGVTFTGTVYPIIETHCNSCHSAVMAPSLGKNIVLDNYTHIKYNVDKGSFRGSIEYNPEYIGMPVEGQLDDCTIQKINSWIERGAPND